ncbi:hypothetical protein KC850_02755 [Candidatus Kaiserbacteria bacterium]|nr:hypothetical protein [Candidatus Kaiserbacteria bacterium]
MKNKIFLAVGAVGLFILGYVTHSTLGVTTSVSYPTEFTYEEYRTELACSAQISSFLHADKSNKKIIGETSEGTDKFSVKINRDEGTLSILTAAEMESGSQTPTVYSIINENEDGLSAVWGGESTNQISSFVFNKNNGFAVYSTNRDSLLGNEPTANAIYFTCI